MINIDIVGLREEKIDQSFVKRVIKKTISLSGRKIKVSPLSIVFVEKRRIRALNRIYRKKNKPTDILSFNYSSGYNKKGIEGELFLCPEIIKESAKEKNVSFQKELAFVLSHGILHLLGFRHGRKMYELQDKVIMQIHEYAYVREFAYLPARNALIFRNNRN